MKTFRTAFAIALASVILSGAYFIGWAILGFLIVFVILMATSIYISKFFIKENDSKMKILIKQTISFGLSSLFYVTLIYGYTMYAIKSLPINSTFIENYRVVRLSNFLGFQYVKGISNSGYVVLRQQFRGDLDKYKITSNEEREIIWNNMIKTAILMKKTSKLLDGMKPVNIHNAKIEYMIDYEFYGFGDLFLTNTKFYLLKNGMKNNYVPIDLYENSVVKFKIKQQKGDILYVAFPYVDKIIYIKKSDKDRFEKIAKNLDLIHKYLSINAKYLKKDL